ncbi:HD-GYP domain-containing protein [Desulfovibrio cuneatus]|uniref:HD-GYP domain-containing protein n=1 Tax=Desulfovibrio cuneatus TaxID=159728 RepID=UPI000411452C|nr:HD-GYP domain-containing protein [Desulfovibrio cuneatus]
MIQKMSIEELAVGMRIIGRGLGWQIQPNTFGEDLDITSQEQIHNIRELGYTEAFVYLPDPPEQCAPAQPTQPFPPPGYQGPTVALAEELPKAQALHAKCTVYAQKFMSDSAKGRFNYDEAEPFVEGLLASTQRNPGALLSLSRLHQTDAYTYKHCVNVAILSISLARSLHHDTMKVFTTGYAGLFHDLGKALVPKQILNAPRKLSTTEFKVMQEHPTLGYRELMRVPQVQEDVLRGTLEHHEKFDGTGYPGNLAGAAISHIGTVVGMADVYDALTSQRPYKSSIPQNTALGIMFQMRNKAWAESMLAEFIQMLGVYPVGSVVELEDGTLAVVTDVSENSTAPKVMVVQSQLGKTIREMRDLTRQGEARIVTAYTAEEKNVDVLSVLASVTE